MRFDVDLTFSASIPAADGEEPEHVAGTIEGHGQELTIRADSLSVFPSLGKFDRGAMNQLALRLKRAGVKINVEGPDGTLVSVGNVKPTIFERAATGSSAIKPGKIAATKKLLNRKAAVADSFPMAIPGTLFPLLPTFLRNYRMRSTTTHYASGGGRPRLIFVRDSESWDGKAPKIFNLTTESLAIGGSPGADLTLAGLDDVHARIVHNELDEYELVAEAPIGGSVGMRAGNTQTLRSGARIEMGDWRLVFFREEYADHGRPFGGRSGGELSFQKPQYNPRTGQIERDPQDWGG